MSERGPNDIDLGPNDKGIILHVLVLWNLPFHIVPFQRCRCF